MGGLGIPRRIVGASGLRQLETRRGMRQAGDSRRIWRNSAASPAIARLNGTIMAIR
jgi:hypothetical protein